MNKIVTLLDGTHKVIEVSPEWGDAVCLICGADYIEVPQYCDETLECAFDEGDHLVNI